MQLNYPELIIFDWDGTLVDSFDLLYAAHNHVRQTMGLTPWSKDQARQYIRASAREIYPRIYGASSEQALELLYNYVEKHHISGLTRMPSASEVLAYLGTETNVLLAVVSNKNQLYLEREIDHLDWTDYFHCVIGAGTAEYDKPSKAPVEYLLERLKTFGISIPDKDRIWLVGDTETDMICAHSAQITAAFVRNGFGHDDIIHDYKPKVVLNDCKNLHSVLQNGMDKYAIHNR